MLTLLISFCPVVCIFLVDCRPAVVLFIRLVLGDGLKGSTPCLCALCARFRGGRGEEKGADAARCTGALLPESPVGKVRPWQRHRSQDLGAGEAFIPPSHRRRRRRRVFIGIQFLLTGVEPYEEWGPGAGDQADSHPPAGSSPHPAGPPAWQAGGTWDELLGSRMGPAAS